MYPVENTNCIACHEVAFFYMRRLCDTKLKVSQLVLVRIRLDFVARQIGTSQKRPVLPLPLLLTFPSETGRGSASLERIFV